MNTPQPHNRSAPTKKSKRNHQNRSPPKRFVEKAPSAPTDELVFGTLPPVKVDNAIFSAAGEGILAPGTGVPAPQSPKHVPFKTEKDTLKEDIKELVEGNRASPNQIVDDTVDAPLPDMDDYHITNLEMAIGIISMVIAFLWAPYMTTGMFMAAIVGQQFFLRNFSKMQMKFCERAAINMSRKQLEQLYSVGASQLPVDFDRRWKRHFRERFVAYYTSRLTLYTYFKPTSLLAEFMATINPTSLFHEKSTFNPRMTVLVPIIGRKYITAEGRIGGLAKSVTTYEHVNLIQHLAEYLRQFTNDGKNGTWAILHNRADAYMRELQVNIVDKISYIDAAIHYMRQPLPEEIIHQQVVSSTQQNC